MRYHVFAIMRCDIKILITAHCGIAGDYRSGSGFLSKPGKCHHDYCHGCQQLPLLLAFIGDDSPGRYRALDMELEWSQHHLRNPGDAQWNLGLWNS